MKKKNNQTVSKSFFQRQDCGYTLWFCQVIFLCRDERVHSVVQVWAVSDSFFPCLWQNMQTWLQKEKRYIKVRKFSFYWCFQPPWQLSSYKQSILVWQWSWSSHPELCPPCIIRVIWPGYSSHSVEWTHPSDFAFLQDAMKWHGGRDIVPLRPASAWDRSCSDAVALSASSLQSSLGFMCSVPKTARLSNSTRPALFCVSGSECPCLQFPSLLNSKSHLTGQWAWSFQVSRKWVALRNGSCLLSSHQDFAVILFHS